MAKMKTGMAALKHSKMKAGAKAFASTLPKVPSKAIIQQATPQAMPKKKKLTAGQKAGNALFGSMM